MSASKISSFRPAPVVTQHPSSRPSTTTGLTPTATNRIGTTVGSQGKPVTAQLLSAHAPIAGPGGGGTDGVYGSYRGYLEKELGQLSKQLKDIFGKDFKLPDFKFPPTKEPPTRQPPTRLPPTDGGTFHPPSRGGHNGFPGHLPGGFPGRGHHYGHESDLFELHAPIARPGGGGTDY